MQQFDWLTILALSAETGQRSVAPKSVLSAVLVLIGVDLLWDCVNFPNVLFAGYSVFRLKVIQDCNLSFKLKI